jgi:hypothetical protein
MTKYSIELGISVETDADDLDDATDTAQDLIDQLRHLIQSQMFQGWIDLIEIIELEGNTNG